MSYTLRMTQGQKDYLSYILRDRQDMLNSYFSDGDEEQKEIDEQKQNNNILIEKISSMKKRKPNKNNNLSQ